MNVGNKSLAEQAYDILLEQILSRKLPPGSILQERGLAAELGVSRTPIREAIGRLEAEGLIIRHPNQLPSVKEITINEFLEALHIRHLLESEAAALAAPEFPGTEVRCLREKFHKLMETPNPSPNEHWGVDDELHETIAKASGNSLLVGIIASLRRRTRMFNLKRMPERFLPGCREHLQILEALERNDADAARQAMSEHISNVRESIISGLQKLFQ